MAAVPERKNILRGPSDPIQHSAIADLPSKQLDALGAASDAEQLGDVVTVDPEIS